MTRPSRDTPGGRAYLALRALARATGRGTAEILQLYVLERFVARVVSSASSDRLILKGGVLMAAFGQRRPTRDVDLLALDVDNDPETVGQLVREIAQQDLDDGLAIDPDSIRARTIRQGAHYAGVRVRLLARLATARIVFHVDVNVGDPVVPPPALTDLPSLLDAPAVRVLAYPIEMVVAEKLVTALERGGTNTRWRDFVDLLLLMNQALSMSAASTAIHRVAVHRHVRLGSFRDVRAELGSDAQPKWAAWRRKQGLVERTPERLDELLELIEPWTDDLLARAQQSGGSKTE